jgi:RND superfamily putative drug exporter
MGKNLHRLGAYAFSHPWRIISTWLIIIALLSFAASQFIKPTSPAISIPGTEAQKAIDRMGELFPEGGKGSGRIVFAAPSGKQVAEYKSTIDTVAAQTKKIDGVTQVITPTENPAALSEDGTIAYLQVQLKNGNSSVPLSTLDKINTIVTNARKDNLTVEMGGDLINRAPTDILGVGEIGGVVLALVVLLMTLGSLIAAGMPIVIALVAVGTSMAALFSLSQVITIGATTPVLAVMLGLAVGIDYSLFIISKYRSYVLQGYKLKDAVAKANATAGNAVVFAAATVVIALAALTIVGIPFMATMGLAGAATIAIAAMVAISLLPGLLGLFGARVFSKKTQIAISDAQVRGVGKSQPANHQTIWYRWGRTITNHPFIALLLATLIVVIVALPVRQLTLGLPTDEHAAKSSTEHKAYELLSRGFGAGTNGPLLIVVEHMSPVGEAERTMVREGAIDLLNKQAAEAAAAQQTMFAEKAAQVATIDEYYALQQEIADAQAAGESQKATAMAGIDNAVAQYAKFVQLRKVSDGIARLSNVAEVVPAAATKNGTEGIIQLIPKSAPSEKATDDLIAYLRNPDNRADITGDSAVNLAVTGSTALQNDINVKLANALPQYLAVVVGLSLILLAIAFRSVLVPIKATLGFLLSVFAMLGAIVAIFQWGWFGIAAAPGPIVSFLPIISLGILFGLAMDYEFFLVSSMHESHMHGKKAKEAVVEGFGLGSRVVTAAGIIMVSIFAGFIFNHDTTIQAIGFGLAVGIFIDAFIVRMTIVPAVMTLLGDKAWWLPRWLDRLLPHVSIEGEDDLPPRRRR